MTEVQSLLLVWGAAAATLVWAVALTAFAVAGVQAARRREFSLGTALWGRPRERARRVEGREAVTAGVVFAVGFGLFAGVAWLAVAKLAVLGWSLAASRPDAEPGAAADTRRISAFSTCRSLSGGCC